MLAGVFIWTKKKLIVNQTNSLVFFDFFFIINMFERSTQHEDEQSNLSPKANSLPCIVIIKNKSGIMNKKLFDA